MFPLAKPRTRGRSRRWQRWRIHLIRISLRDLDEVTGRIAQPCRTPAGDEGVEAQRPEGDDRVRSHLRDLALHVVHPEREVTHAGPRIAVAFRRLQGIRLSGAEQLEQRPGAAQKDDLRALAKVDDPRPAEAEVLGVEPLHRDRIVAGKRDVVQARIRHKVPSSALVDLPRPQARACAALIRSAHLSPIITMPAWQLPEGTAGMTLASATRSPSTRFTRSSGSTTASASRTIRQDPAWWWYDSARARTSSPSSASDTFGPGSTSACTQSANARVA